MDKVRLQQIEDRYKAAAASCAAGIDAGVAYRVCAALGQETEVVLMHQVTRQRLARQLAQEYLLSDIKSLIHAVKHGNIHYR